MRKFNAVYKEKQAISEKILEERILTEFKSVYSGLLEQYEVSEFYDMNEDTQVAFLRELNEYWTEEEGLSDKGNKFLKTKSAILTESSTDLQKKSYLKNKATAVISETLRQSHIKNKIYDVINEMYKSTESKELADVLPVNIITGTILESFGTALQDIMTEIVYEIAPDENLNEREFSAKQRKKDAGTGAAMKDGSFPIENEQDLKNAIKAIGRSKNPEAAKKHIKSRAKSLGKTSLLPDSWK